MKSHFAWAALCAAALGVFFTQHVRGADAVYIPGYVANDYSGGTIEVQGTTGRIDVPVSFQSAPVDLTKALTVAGVTGSDSTVYTLLSSAFSLNKSTLLLSDPHSGALLGNIQLDTRLSDIAYTNGRLYGITYATNAMQIDAISPNGTTQSILNQSVPSSFATWRLSGSVSGNTLVAARGSFESTEVPGYVINPAVPSVSSITLAGTQQTQLYDMVIHAAGDAITSVVSGNEVSTSLPAGTPQGSVPYNSLYGKASLTNTVSDEFHYNYGPAQEAAAQTSWNLTVSPIQGLTDGLTRIPQVVTASGPVVINNHVTPDDTTLSNVSANTKVQQYFGSPAAFSSLVQNANPGDFSERTIGQVSAALNLSAGQRGMYAMGINTSMTADYSYGTALDQGRPVQATLTRGDVQLAYDPISNNLVGNGDASMNGAGWQGTLGTTFISQAANSDPSNHRFYVVGFSTQAGKMRQFLQEPTPNSAMELSFTYSLQSTPVHDDELQVWLDSTLVADVMPTTTTTLTFDTLIDDPALENIADPVLLIKGMSSSSTGDTIFIGNISLSAVPEPTAGYLACASFVLCLRRRRSAGPKLK